MEDFKKLIALFAIIVYYICDQIRLRNDQKKIKK